MWGFKEDISMPKAVFSILIIHAMVAGFFVGLWMEYDLKIMQQPIKETNNTELVGGGNPIDPHHIENVVKTWVENDLRPEIDSTIKSQVNLAVSPIKKDVSTIKGEIQPIQNDITSLKGEIRPIQAGLDTLEANIASEVEKALKPIFEASIDALKPQLKAVVNLYDKFPPQQSSLRVGCVELQWNSAFSKNLADRLYALVDKSEVDLVTFIDYAEPDMVGIDCELDIPLVGERSLGIEIEAYWDIPTFKKVWNDIKSKI